MQGESSSQTVLAVLEAEHFQSFLDALADEGYLTIGPKVSNGAIIYDETRSTDDLPIGYSDKQEPGSYRLIRGKKKTFFDYTVGPETLRKYLRPATERICTVELNRRMLAWIEPKKKSKRGLVTPKPFTVTLPDRPVVKRAFLGVRPCELQALAIYDKVHGEGAHADEVYLQDRENMFVITVNCTNPGGTCFCNSMHTGPKASSGFDLSLTELIDSERHCFLVEAGSKRGRALLGSVQTTEPTEADITESEKLFRRAEGKFKTSLDSESVAEMLFSGFDNPHWEDIALRCLSCGSCTMVCPTCFCFTIEDRTDLSGGNAERLSKWDSCHTLDHSYIHGGNIRPSVASRYRQWMMHKLAYWHEQFGTSGCVGCGRCITWCPSGIDIAEEANLILEKI